MTPTDPAESTNDSTHRFTRRRVVAGAAGAMIALPAAIALGAPYRLSDDDDDDRDNSGPGNAEDSNRDDHDDHDDNAQGGSDDEGDVAASGTVPAGSVEVQIVDDDADGFQPQTVTVDAGQSITFVNLDDDPHTATGADFDTGIMQPGDLVTITIDEPGSFGYSCLIHPVMIGTIDVRDADGAVPASPQASPEASPAATPAGATPAGASETSVAIQNFEFDPQEIEVALGTTVTWTNQDQVPHTATNTDGEFDTGTLEDGGSGSYTFDTAGRFEYVCIFHANMAGVVTVV